MSNSVRRAVFRALPRVLPFLRLGTDLLGKFPTARDSWPEKLAKVLAIADTVNVHYGSGKSKLNEIVVRYDMEGMESEAFVRLFFGTPLREGFTVERSALDEHTDLVEARTPGGGRLLFVERRDGTTIRFSGTFYHSAGIDLGHVIDQLWHAYPDGIYVSVEPYSTGFGHETTVTSVPVAPMRYFSRSARERLAEVVEAHRGFAAAGVHRTYLLVGPRGTGKTSFAVKLAKEFGGRLLALDAAALPGMNSKELTFILELLRPRFLLIDDIEQAPMESVRARMRFLFTMLKVRFPGTTVVLAVNDPEKLDPALLRPGRIDMPIDFDPPPPAEREEMVTALLAEHEVASTPELVAGILDVTEGMGHAYLADLCLRLKQEPAERVMRSVRRLYALAEAARAAAKGNSVTLEACEMVRVAGPDQPPDPPTKSTWP